jgi:CHASE3 domain sensor protein
MSVDLTKSHKAMDAQQHERTYNAFVKAVVFCTGLIILVLVMMAIFLV